MGATSCEKVGAVAEKKKATSPAIPIYSLWRQKWAPVVGQLGKLRPIVNRPTAALRANSGGSQPPRGMPSCPTSRRRFHFYAAHPSPPSQPRRVNRTPYGRPSPGDLQFDSHQRPLHLLDAFLVVK